ncbi:biotin transport system permease protein [Cohaesibacter sp. ES.047]|uniref:energy-coupling factor transporter transmembrane component T family protein n=1 Tax=Cohaesibacter sp. ES.047 TaxID=1798205 RepID=UPI000BB8FA60|nr:energy-coupling factor transporter transmembrane component T [Cohaesibacter sp. ES.047]SNY92655.1 biotin transport system permease protein [Cohaesibacter sp. ES.047]
MLSLTVNEKTWLHGISVPLKLGLLAIITLLMLPINGWLSASLLTLIVAGLYLSAGMAFARAGLKHLRPLVWLLGLIFLYHVVTDRAEEGFAICLKIFAMVGLANLVTMSSRLDDMMAVVDWLSRPFYRFGLPPRAMGLAMGLVIRFTPVFLQKAGLLNEAWRARRPRGTSPRVIVPLALGALDDADRVADALRARGGLATAINGDDGSAQKGHMSGTETQT